MLLEAAGEQLNYRLGCHHLPCQDLNCQEEEDPMNKLKGQKIVSCRICKGDHWTTAAPTRTRWGHAESWQNSWACPLAKEKLPEVPGPWDIAGRLGGWGRSGSGTQGRASLGVVGPHLGSGQDQQCWWLSPHTAVRLWPQPTLVCVKGCRWVLCW